MKFTSKTEYDISITIRPMFQTPTSSVVEQIERNAFETRLLRYSHMLANELRERLNSGDAEEWLNNMAAKCMELDLARLNK